SCMLLLCIFQPGLEFRTGFEALVESTFFHVLFPVRGVTHLGEKIHVVFLLLRRYTTCHKDTAQHGVVGRNTGFLASWNIVPGLGLGDFGFVWHTFVIEHALCRQLACTPLRNRFDRVVHSRLDVTTHQLHSHCATAFERDVDELGARCFFHSSSNDLVFLL